MQLLEPLLRLGAFLAVFGALLLLERRYPFLPPPPGRLQVQATNLSLSVIGTLLLRLSIPGLAMGAAGWAHGHGVGVFDRSGLPPAIAAAAGLVALDVAVYLQHRAFHAVPWLWRLHAVHHSEQHLDATTGLRFHPLELLISMLWKIAVVVALGVPAGGVLAFEIALNATSMLEHANLVLPQGLDRRLRALLVTPAMHRWHHSTRGPESLRNFGFCLSLWDRIFSSYDGRPALPADPRIGLPAAAGAEPAPTLWQMLILKVF